MVSFALSMAFLIDVGIFLGWFVGFGTLFKLGAKIGAVIGMIAAPLLLVLSLAFMGTETGNVLFPLGIMCLFDYGAGYYFFIYKRRKDKEAERQAAMQAETSAKQRAIREEYESELEVIESHISQETAKKPNQRNYTQAVQASYALEKKWHGSAHNGRAGHELLREVFDENRKAIIELLRAGGAWNCVQAEDLALLAKCYPPEWKLMEGVAAFISRAKLPPAQTLVLSAAEYGKADEAVISELMQAVCEALPQHHAAWKGVCAASYDSIPTEEALAKLCFLREAFPVEDTPSALWHFALSTPHKPDLFAAAKEISEFYGNVIITNEQKKQVRIPTLNGLLSQAYVFSRFSPNLMRELGRDIDSYLQFWCDKKQLDPCTQLASGLAWIKAFDFERKVLSEMLKAGLPMSVQLQERLGFLESGGDNAPEVKEFAAANDNLSYYYASKNWQNNDFTGFFRNLLQQNKALEYCLTVAEWSDRQSYSGTWAAEDIARRLEEKIGEEFGNAVACGYKKLNMITESGAKETAGILIRPTDAELRHFGLLLLGMNIGKRLSLQVLTLYIPEEQQTGRATQMLVDALSLKNGEDPQVKIFAETLQEWLLSSLQDILNESTGSTLY